MCMCVCMLEAWIFFRHSDHQNCDTECLTDFYQPYIKKKSFIFSLLYFLDASGLCKTNILRTNNYINNCCDLLNAAATPDL